MRVLLAVPTFPEVSETFITAKFAGLLRRGLDVHLVCEVRRDDLWDDMPALRDAPGLRERVHVVPRAGDLEGLGATVRDALAATLRHPRRLAAYGGQLLADHPRRAPRLVPLDALAAALRPDVVHYEFGAMAAERVAVRRLTGASLSVSFRGWDINWFGLGDPDAYAALWREVDAVHCLGADLLRRARRRGLPDDVPVTLIPPAVDIEFFAPATQQVRRPGPLRVLTIARLHWKKGHEHALAAIAALRARGVAVEYRIVGSGPHEPAVRAAIDALGLAGTVQLEGSATPARVRDHLHRADVLLHAATSEGFCNAVLEAQACGVPVVCSDADGLSENVSDGVTGFVVPRRDPAALAAALGRLADDAPARVRMGFAGRRRVEEQFRAEDQIDRWVAYFAAQRPGRSRTPSPARRRDVTPRPRPAVLGAPR
jgi:colanic acid/amylovoran biosynthesis glycosyltransferase